MERKFTIDEKKQMAQDYESGLSIQEIRKKYNIPEGTLRYVLSKNKITLRSRVVRINKLNTAQKAYLAGLLDGEGRIGIDRKKPKHSNGCRRDSFVGTIRITNTYLECLEWIKKTVHVGSVIRAGKKKKGNKQAYEYRANTLQAVSILKQVTPYLIIKQKQANILLQLAELRYDQKGKFKGRNGITNEQWQRQEKLYNQLAALNKKGEK